MTDLSRSARALAPQFHDLSRTALFVDLDGTLLEIEAQPEDVRADARLCYLLRVLEARTGGALAILTGRSLDDADRVLAESVQCVAALHGQNCRLREGMLHQMPPTEALSRARALISGLVTSSALEAELEDKGGAIALHYRSRPEQGPLIARAVDEIAAQLGLRALHGKMVAEILPFGATKGAALSTLMQAAPFAGRVPIAIGDDITDEDAFEAANELGGLSILVGERESSAARYALPDVAAVRAWLEAGL